MSRRPQGNGASAAVPVIGRVAGLPAEVVERFATDLCDPLRAEPGQEAELEEVLTAIADRLHAAVPGAAPAFRRLLLAIRRDCHNRRPISRHLAAPAWPAVREIIGALGEHAAALEASREERSASFRAAFEQKQAEQRRILRESVGNRGFMRALALASPDLFSAAGSLRDASPGRGSRREAKAEAALLRYLTRAAVKVSPFSAFTPVALGVLRDDAGPAGLRLRGGRWRTRSLVRFRRYLLQQWVEMLCRYAPVRDRLPVTLNNSAVESEPGRLLFLRPASWEPDTRRGLLCYRPQALVRTGANGPLVSRVIELLARFRPTYGQLVALLRSEAPGEDASPAAEQVSGLLELGLLRLALPWPAHESHLESRICEYLRSIPGDALLDAFTERLERLVELEDAYAETGDPLAAVLEIRRLREALWEAAAPLGGVDPARVAPGGAGATDLYEDVLLLPPRGESPAAPIFHFSRAAAEEALHNAELLVRLTALFDNRNELCAALADFAARRWPGRAEVGVLELFQAVQPLWRDYLAFRKESWKAKEGRATWNPGELAAVEKLRAARADVIGSLAGCLLPDGGGQRVSVAALRDLLDRAPASYAAGVSWGAGLFLMPASTDGSLWVLNTMREGTGRSGSRFTPVMGETGCRYAEHLAARGTLDIAGEIALLLDVHCVEGDTLNVHAPQAPGVLTMPGDDADVAPQRRVRLCDLRIRFEGPERSPTLRGRDGQRYLPVHLGAAFEAYMPPLLRFLCTFGPGDMAAVLPPRSRREEGELVVSDRTVLGNLVLHRKTWSVPVARLAAALPSGGDAEAFASLNRLRIAWGIPDRVFLAEPIATALVGTVWKPQYLDFTSPLFLPLVRSAAEGGGERLTLHEMLPEPEMYPRDGEGRRWALEVLVDSIGVRAPDPRLRTPLPPVRERPRRTAAASVRG